jgi:hypothetical protein
MQKEENIILHICRNISLHIINSKVCRLLSDKVFVSIKYFITIRKKLNLKNPRGFNEKIQWLKLNDRKLKYVTYVDKYLVRDYVSRTIGAKYLIPLVGGPWKSASCIDFNELPNKFVLKCNHDSASVVVCTNKAEIKFDNVIKRLNLALKNNYFYAGREWPYKGIKRNIIAEKYISNNNNEESNDLTDYKVLCFNGKARCIFTGTERNNGKGLKVTFFDTEWNRMPFERHYPASKETIEKPYNLSEMIAISEALAVNIPFVRIDLYESCGKIYFGEMTLYPGSGFEEFTPNQWDYTLGSWLNIDNLLYPNN